MTRASGPETDGFTDFLLPRVPGDTTDPDTHDVMAALRALARRAFGRGGGLTQDSTETSD